MKQLFKIFCAFSIAVGLVGCIAAPIEMTAQTEQRLRAQAPIRFLLTFDDGPSASSFWNPTMTILDSLATNPVQPNLKAVFFVQTGAPRAGDSDIGREVMRREHADGQILGFHTATHWHTNHRYLSPEELEQSLTKGSADIAAITAIYAVEVTDFVNTYEYDIPDATEMLRRMRDIIDRHAGLNYRAFDLGIGSDEYKRLLSLTHAERQSMRHRPEAKVLRR